MSSKWTAADVPDQSGRVAIVTGANSGSDYDTAAVLADKGAHVVLAVRNLDKGNEAVDRIKSTSPNAVVAVQELDLTSLDSVRKAADELRANHPRIDLLINNAGVMYVPTRPDHQGRLRAAVRHQPPRPFRVDRSAARQHAAGRGLAGGDGQQRRPPDPARIHFDDLQLERKYNRVDAYGQSKLANLLFTYELQRRLKLKGAPTIALAAHPGFADTDLLRNLPGIGRSADFFWTTFISQTRRYGSVTDLARRHRPQRTERPVLRTRRHRRTTGPPESR